MLMTENSKVKERLFAVFMMIFGIGMVLYFIIFKERGEFSSEYTDTLLWASTEIDAKSIYDPNFWYAYILPFGGTTIMLPFVFLFGITYKAHICGMSVFAVVFLLSLYALLRKMKLSYMESAAATAICAVLFSVSKTMRMIFWGHVIHYSLGLLCLWVALVLLSNISFGHDFLKSRKQIISFLFLEIWTFLCCSNGFSIVLFFAVPFLGALILERFLDVSVELFDKKNIHAAIVCMAAAFAAVFGFLFYYMGQRGIYRCYENFFSVMVPSEEWLWEPVGFMRSWITLAAGELRSGINIASTQAIMILILFVFALVIIIVPICALFSYKKMENQMMRILLLSHWILSAVTLIIYNISNMKGTNWRLCGLFASGIVVSVVYAVWLTKQKEFMRFGGILCMFYILVALLSAVQLLKLPSAYGTNRYDRLTEVLEEHGLNYGYAEYWSGNVTTVLSDSRVKVRPIIINKDGSYEIRMYQSTQQWYEDQPDVKQYFVFLSDGEYRSCKDTLREDCIEEFPFDADGYILVFDHNLFGSKKINK